MDQRGGISIIHSSLAEKADTPSYARSWESDLDIHLEPEQWLQSFCHSYKGIMNISLGVASIKVFTRWYYIPARLARMFPDNKNITQKSETR